MIDPAQNLIGDSKLNSDLVAQVPPPVQTRLGASLLALLYRNWRAQAQHQLSTSNHSRTDNAENATPGVPRLLVTTEEQKKE